MLATSKYPQRLQLEVSFSLFVLALSFNVIDAFQPSYPFTKVSHTQPTSLSLLRKPQVLDFFNTSNVKDSLFPEETAIDQGTTYQVQDEFFNDETMVFVMMALIFAIGSLSSLDRVAMSVALVPMSDEFGYTDTLKGSISSLFSVGYGIGIVPSGLLLASLSPRLIMAAGILMWSAGTLATPFAAAQSNMAVLLFARALVGASESVVIPTIQRLLSNWIPADKKGIAVAVVFSGFQVGTILAYSISPSVIDAFDGNWRSLFFLYGSLGVGFLLPWLTLSRDEPAAVTQARQLPAAGSNAVETEESSLDKAKGVFQSAPWREFVRSKGVWGMFFAHAANNWGLYNNLSWTPTFYNEQYGLNVKESAVLLVVPSIVGAIGGLSAGTIADKMIQNMEVVTVEGVTKVRKLFQGIALYGPAACLAILSHHIPEKPWVAQALLAGTVGMQSFNAAGYGAANQEKAGEKWTGLLYSITSLPSVIIGTFSVFLTGELLDATNQDWSYVFGINSAVFALGATAFVTLYDSKKEFD